MLELDFYVDDFTQSVIGVRAQVLRHLPAAARSLLWQIKHSLGCDISMEKADLVASSHDLLLKLKEALG